MHTSIPLIMSFIALFSPIATGKGGEIAPFKSLCVSDKETGFNWKNGDWVKANFKADTKILIQKVDMASYKSKTSIDSPVRCVDMQAPRPVMPGSILTQTDACYLISRVGGVRAIFNSEKCTETFAVSTLVSIECRHITFLPDGPFIELPSYLDVQPHPKSGDKESLVMMVGKCSSFTEK